LNAKLLFCTTDSKGFEPHYSNTRVFNYQNSAYMGLAPDTYGLQSWFDFRPRFNAYDFIWLHLDPRIMSPDWYAFPRLIKQEAPNVKLLVSHEYWEKYCDEELPFVVKNAMKYADYIQVNSQDALHALEGQLEPPLLYCHPTVPLVADFMDPVPWEERDGVAMLEHTVYTPLVKAFEIIKESGLKAVCISSNPTHPAEFWDHYFEAFGVEGKGYGRLKYNQYTDILRHCRVGLDYGYTGICRFAYESALVNVPVVGHNRLEYRNILYPDLTAYSIDGGAYLLRKAHDNEEYSKTLNTYAGRLIHEYFTDEAAHKRVAKMLRGIGVEVE